MLSVELVDLIESGVSMKIATRDESRMPECAVGVGARVHEGAEMVTLYVARGPGDVTVANLAIEPRIAATFSRVHDFRTYQIKGVATVREARDDERATVEAYRAGLAMALDFAGIPRRLTMRVRVWPAYAIDVRVTDIFLQTPGPDAGARMP